MNNTSRDKTPCEELGYKVGDRFITEGDNGNFSAGSVIELDLDDGSTCPMFKLIEGCCDYSQASQGQSGAYAELECINKLEWKPMNKIRELITDWDSLEVGDKAVFEGYNGLDRTWVYSKGLEYTYKIDADGDVGFIEDESNVCPYLMLNRFNFRLISKASDSTTTSADIQEGEWIDTRGFTSEQVLAAAEWMSERHGVPVDDYVQSCNTDTIDFLVVNYGEVYVWTFDPVNELDDYGFKVQVVPTFKITTSVDSFEFIQNKSEKELQLEAEIATLTAQAEQQKQAVAESLKLIEEAKSKLTK